jgi:hypothetical protein
LVLVRLLALVELLLTEAALALLSSEGALIGAVAAESRILRSDPGAGRAANTAAAVKCSPTAQ